jgi:hypothetical protein
LKGRLSLLTSLLTFFHLKNFIMEIKPAIRKQQPIRLALYGPSGSGKTYSALLLALGLCGNWQKIVVIDTEEESASLYADLGPFNIIPLSKPFHPSKFYEAIDLAEDSGMEVIIVDSLSPEWSGEGGVDDPLNEGDQRELLQEHRCLLSLLTSCTTHVICTLHTRQQGINITELPAGHLEPITTPVQQEGIVYRFTSVLRLDEANKAHVVKDCTGVFTGKEPVVLTPEHGAFLSNWCRSGEPAVPPELQARINACKTVKELHLLIAREDLEDMQLVSAFTRRRLELEGEAEGEEDNRPTLSIA